MKKLRSAFSIIFCLLAVFSFTFSAAAESIKYDLTDLGMKISIPDNMTVKTKENSTDLKSGIYLEAINSESSLIISVSMVQDAETQKVYSFIDQPYSVLEEYKEHMESLGFSEGKDGSYGDVPFLDFSQKSTSETGLDIYTRHSITLINGMCISVVSQSPGDNFTSDELSIIKNCLDSIRFDGVGDTSTGVTFWGVVLWLFIILIVLALLLLLISYYMGKKNNEKKRTLAQERQRKADYDVLKRADLRNKQSNKTGIQGYKSSSDYFEKGFDTEATPNTAPPVSNAPTTAEKAVKETKTAVTHMGYFFKNLKRELKNNKKSSKSKSTQKGKRKAVDYDIFNEK